MASTHTTETVTSADGTEIAFERAGSGPPLVLAHGTGGDHTGWMPVLPSLEEHATIYAMDRRGVGESGDADEYDLEREVEDVVAVVESIDDPVFLLGHSYGALISLEAALRTENLHKLILYEPWFTVGDHELVSDKVLEEMETLLADDENEQVLVLLLREVPDLPPDVIDAFRAAPNWQDIVATAPIVPRELHEQREYEFDATRFADLVTPTVLLSGAENPPFFKDPTKAVDDALPNSRIVTLEGQQHMANGLAPDLFSDEVLAVMGESH